MQKQLTLYKKGSSEDIAREILEDEAIVTAGTDPGATILLDGEDVSPEQFVIVNEGGDIVLMNSAEGTSLNEQALKPGSRISLSFGDVVGTGDFELHYSGVSDDQETVDSDGESELTVIEDNQTESDSEGNGSAAVRAKEKKDFSKILYDLKEEDSFYFHVVGKDDVVERVPFLNDQMWIGTRMGNVVVATDSATPDEVCARVNKDWSGVVLYPKEDQQIFLNDVQLLEPERLKNDDKLTLFDDFDGAFIETFISFHEPVSLLALSSILPEELPHPVSSDKKPSQSEKGVRELIGSAAGGAAVTDSRASSGLIFGYFTPLEVIIMALGTVVTAIIIFFVLEFV